MKIISGRPPNYQDILRVFPSAQRMEVIFAYAPDIYAPGGNVPPQLVVHETVHIERQTAIGVERWWELYLGSSGFRYQEELLAHRAEYRYMIGENASRQHRRGALKIVAKRLCSPLYGQITTLEKAMKDLIA